MPSKVVDEPCLMCPWNVPRKWRAVLVHRPTTGHAAGPVARRFFALVAAQLSFEPRELAFDNAADECAREVLASRYAFLSSLDNVKARYKCGTPDRRDLTTVLYALEFSSTITVTCPCVFYSTGQGLVDFLAPNRSLVEVLQAKHTPRARKAPDTAHLGCLTRSTTPYKAYTPRQILSSLSLLVIEPRAQWGVAWE